MTVNAHTVLFLAGIGVPPYSARGLQQTLEPIATASDLQRTINGALIDLSVAQLRKYKSTISGTDQEPPAVDGIWPGQEVMVDCISELCHAEYEPAGRDVVEGSEREEAGFVFYRPRITMLVMNFTTTKDEYGATVAWTLDLEEQ